MLSFPESNLGREQLRSRKHTDHAAQVLANLEQRFYVFMIQIVYNVQLQSPRPLWSVPNNLFRQDSQHLGDEYQASVKVTSLPAHLLARTRGLQRLRCRIVCVAWQPVSGFCDAPSTHASSRTAWQQICTLALAGQSSHMPQNAGQMCCNCLCYWQRQHH